MQNVLVDDRRIWVDLCVFLTRCLHFLNPSYSALSPCLDSTAHGPTIPKWARAAERRAASEVGMIWRKHADIERVAEKMIVVTMEWCSKSPTLDHLTAGKEAAVGTGKGIVLRNAASVGPARLCHVKGLDAHRRSVAHIAIVRYIYPCLYNNVADHHQFTPVLEFGLHCA
jgi:hypothetical protein